MGVISKYELCICSFIRIERLLPGWNWNKRDFSREVGLSLE